MPLLKLQTSVSLSDKKTEALLASLSKIVAETIGKPEQYVMVTMDTTSVMMAGKAGDAAFADLRSIGGLGPDVNTRLSQRICDALNESLGLAPNRVYINFTDVSAASWGWNRDTF